MEVMMRTIVDRLPRGTLYVSLTIGLILSSWPAMRAIAASGAKTVTPTTLYTAILVSDSNGGLSCSVTNVSATSHIVSMDLIDDSGIVNNLASLMPVGPNETLHLGIIGANAFYCKITVDGPASDVRAEELLADCTPTDLQPQCTLATAAVAIAY
jgi:hypothetical protein